VDRLSHFLLKDSSVHRPLLTAEQQTDTRDGMVTVGVAKDPE